ncbi:50S ribosomal protein L35 [Demequina litorisediminis]|uniref:Uncharacterized protein n=1 Tax=Demequina litorisediminis TaxID=1849022 RepID=A0ABQ6IJ88_9MICO|nr:hypothetical protein GCM10025876_34210 [Demequina litorisediminis]
MKHSHAMNVHKFEEKTSSRKRRVAQDAILSDADSKKIKKPAGQVRPEERKE